MTVAFQRMFGILERYNNNHVTPSLSKLHELSYRLNVYFDILLLDRHDKKNAVLTKLLVTCGSKKIMLGIKKLYFNAGNIFGFNYF